MKVIKVSTKDQNAIAGLLRMLTKTVKADLGTCTISYPAELQSGTIVFQIVPASKISSNEPATDTGSTPIQFQIKNLCTVLRISLKRLSTTLGIPYPTMYHWSKGYQPRKSSIHINRLMSCDPSKIHLVTQSSKNTTSVIENK